MLYPVAVGNAIQQLHILGLLKAKKKYSFYLLFFQCYVFSIECNTVKNNQRIAKCE